MTEQDSKTLINQISIPEISVILLITSVGIDWSYYKKLGLSFSEIPSSLSDHFRSIIEWLPQLTLILLIFLLYDLFLLTVILIWLKFYKWVSAYPSFNTIYNLSAQKSIKFIFPFVLCALLLGYISAVRDLYKIKIGNNQAYIILKEHDKGVKHLLRVLEKGIVGYDISYRKAAFYPWEHIERISYNKTILPFHGLLSLTEKNH